ncbi:MAG: DNA polymerase III subunit delta [Alphaproteobacteria bacterium]|nr:DNA polymerase III subunit delta [Alphaproteobacteria bacterium]MBL0717719.1 DNA polymerase III subunit delta [Alphaproteobacteria bacterium]
MPINSYELSKIRSKDHKAFFVFGQDNGAVNEISKKIASDFFDGDQNISWLSYDSDELGDPTRQENLIKELITPNFFNPLKVVKIRIGSNDISSIIEEWLTAYKNFEALIIFTGGDIDLRKHKLYKLLEKDSEACCVRCYHDNPRSVREVVIKTLKKDNIAYSSDVVDDIVFLLGNDRENTKQMLEKLILYTIEKGNINSNDVSKCFKNFSHIQVDDLIHSTLNGNIKNYQTSFDNLKENIEPIFFVRVFSTHIEKLLKVRALVKSGKTEQEAIKLVFFKIFFKYKSQVLNECQLSLELLSDTLEKLNKIEKMMKSNTDKNSIIVILGELLMRLTLQVNYIKKRL